MGSIYSYIDSLVILIMLDAGAFVFIGIGLAIIVIGFFVLWQSSKKTALVQARNNQLQMQVEQLQHQCQEQTQQNDQLTTHLQKLTNTHAETREALVLAESQRDSQKQANAEQKILMQQSRAEFEAFIKQYADASLHQKSEQLTSTNKQQLDLLLKPFRDQISDFRQRVDHVYNQEAQDKRSLVEQINQLKQLNSQLSNDASNLTKALKGDNKVQGNWGEMVLEKVLEQSGLRKGYEYQTQVGLQPEESDTKLKPDVVVHLPDNKDVIIDAKVSLVAYDTYLSAEHEADRADALNAHIQSLKNHISNLSSKSYESLDGVRSLDYVLLFIPVESAYMLALQSDKGEALLFDAMQRNIMVVSPATLLMVLRTIHNIWRYEHQSQNAKEMAKQAEGMYQKLVGFISSLEDVGKRIEQAKISYDKAFNQLSTGRGNVISKAQKVISLGGIRPKNSLNDELTQQAQENNQHTDEPLSVERSEHTREE